MNYSLKLLGLNEYQEKAVNELSGLLDVTVSPDGLPVQFRRSHIQEYSFDGNCGIIYYEKEHQILRGLGIFIENLETGKPFIVRESAAYDQLGVMIDCSRNAVLNIPSFKELIKHLALMGYSNVQLYTEDTYEIKEYPYFGYQRGRYTPEEFKEMDAYAKLFSIELVPCIQTLAHLGRVLKWEAFSELRDCNDILLIDDEKTYTLIDDMFRTMSQNLSSRRINIGMDEAHMVGLGKYLDKHGYKNRMEVMLRHFNRVMDIARKYGYRPMMWSDMFFRLVSGGQYTADDCPIKEELLSQIPEDITLVYWNYYSTEQEEYDKMLRNHKKISSNLVFAGGAWKWNSFTPYSHFSEFVSKAAHKSCQEHNIREVLITSWGDDGAECPLFTVLPVFQIWAELCYSGFSHEEYLERRFLTCAGASYKDFITLGEPILTPDNPAPGRCGINPAKYLLYQDILGGLYDAHVLPDSYDTHFKNCARKIAECSERNPKWSYLFEYHRAFCHVLALKSEMGIRIRKAYHSGEKDILLKTAQIEIPDLLNRVEILLTSLEEQWKKENKIFGLDILELRLGGLKQRLLSASRRLIQYSGGEIDILEELEAEPLPYDIKSHEKGEISVWCQPWHNLVSPSVVVTL